MALVVPISTKNDLIDSLYRKRQKSAEKRIEKYLSALTSNNKRQEENTFSKLKTKSS